MNIMMTLFKSKNQLMGILAPDKTAKKSAHLFLTPKSLAQKPFEKEAENCCDRSFFGNGLSAASWGSGDKKVLLVHGWESRSTQMYQFVEPLLANGFKAIAIDAPGHGYSKGDRPNPVTFANAILAAENEFGPFYGTIGHSMGGAAISIAMESGVRFNRSVLISSPACLYDSLRGFAEFVGLPRNSTRSFIHHVEQNVGRPAKELDVGKVFAVVKPDALLIHAVNDREIPYAAMESITAQHPGVKTYTSKDLGHRRIVQNSEIAKLASNFIANGFVKIP